MSDTNLCVHALTVAEVPSDARVRHYDELPEGVKERFPAWTDGDSAGAGGGDSAGTGDGDSPSLDDGGDSDVRGGDVVKFLDYYRIES